MKFNFKTISMMMAGAALAMTSCSSEEPFGGNQENPQGEGIGYMAFTISTDQTRAGDNEYGGDKDPNNTPNDATIDDEKFSDGQPNEYAICPNTKANLAIFFNEDGSVFSASYLTPFDHKNESTHPNDHDTKYPEQFYTYVTRWNNTNDVKPEKVLVLINVNPNTLYEIETEAKQLANAKDVTALAQILAKTEGTATYGMYNYSGTDYFSMSNSVYLDKNGIACASAIEGKVYDTPEKALENKVTVYVERMLAKFELTFGENGQLRLSANGKGILLDPSNKDNKEVAKINYVENYSGLEDNLDFPDYTPVGWKIFIGNWGINAVEPTNTYFKKVTTEKNYFGDISGWNNNILHRSYWAESANYKETDGFPTQYRPTDYEDGGNTPTNGYFGIDNPNSYLAGNGKTSLDETTLTYYSFNHFTKRGNYKYAPERTYDTEAGFKGFGPYRFASHYLIGAQLILGDENKNVDSKAKDNGNIYMDNVKDKWAAYNYYFGNEKSYIRYAYHRMVSQFADGRKHVLKAGNESQTYQTMGDQAVLYRDEALTKPLAVKDAPAYFITTAAKEFHGDGKVMLALAKDENGEYKKLWYKDKDGNAVELNANDIVRIAFNLSESAQHFTEGKMYYAIPVQHNFGMSTRDRVDVKKDGTYLLGQFGTVRNHWYLLNVKTIGSVGTPVDDPDQPIIPDPEDIYNIALEIVVLPWHQINNGDVNL